MKKNYTIMPEEWIVGVNDNAIKEFSRLGLYTPCQVGSIQSVCGCIGAMSERHAMDMVASFKKKWPYVMFALYEGDTWGTLKLVERY